MKLMGELSIINTYNKNMKKILKSLILSVMLLLTIGCSSQNVSNIDEYSLNKDAILKIIAQDEVIEISMEELLENEIVEFTTTNLNSKSEVNEFDCIGISLRNLLSNYDIDLA